MLGASELESVKVKFTYTTTMSAPRIGGAEGMDVDEAGVATPTNEWMEAAQRAVDTDGILENGPAKRQKVCNPCNTLTALPDLLASDR